MTMGSRLRGRALPRPPGGDLPRPLRPGHLPLPVARDGLLRPVRRAGRRAHARPPASWSSRSQSDWRFATEHSQHIARRARRARRGVRLTRSPRPGATTRSSWTSPSTTRTFASFVSVSAGTRSNGRGPNQRARHHPPRRTVGLLLVAAALRCCPRGRRGMHELERSTRSGTPTRPHRGHARRARARAAGGRAAASAGASAARSRTRSRAGQRPPRRRSSTGPRRARPSPTSRAPAPLRDLSRRPPRTSRCARGGDLEAIVSAATGAGALPASRPSPPCAAATPSTSGARAATTARGRTRRPADR